MGHSWPINWPNDKILDGSSYQPAILYRREQVGSRGPRCQGRGNRKNGHQCPQRVKWFLQIFGEKEAGLGCNLYIMSFYVMIKTGNAIPL